MSAVNPKSQSPWVAVVGNPNCGKTAIFNLLTGLNQKVSNYPGVTVERKMGVCKTGANQEIRILDMPGTYSLTPESYDEQIVTEQVLSWFHDGDAPEAIISVLDASNFSRNLYLTTQLLDLGIPVILVLNMMDRVKHPENLPTDKALKKWLNVPEIVRMTAIRKQGVVELKQALARVVVGTFKMDVTTIPYKIDTQIFAILQPLLTLFQDQFGYSPRFAVGQALRLVTRSSVGDLFQAFYKEHHRESLENIIAMRKTALEHFAQAGISHRILEATIRYAWIDAELAKFTHRKLESIGDVSRSERMDKILTHRWIGPGIFILLLSSIFQVIFSWAVIPMEWIDTAVTAFGQWVFHVMPGGILRDLIVDGIIAGVGSILVFLPQILILVFALTLLEDSGYMARIAFMLDRFMSRLGLHGRSVLPLMSGYACAIPGIMATRTIDSWKERLLTILVVPLMSCSARLPVYALMIGALIPPVKLGGFLNIQGLTLFAMYFLGTATALLLAMLFSRFIKTGEKSSFVMELPPYRVPLMRSVTRQVLLRGKIFIKDAGKIIMAMSIVLWFLATFPTSSETHSIEHSYAGKIGHAIEPVIRPLGFDWKIGVGLITSFAAREVLVSTLATLYNVDGQEEGVVHLKEALKNDVNPKTGKPLYTPLVGLSLMVFYVFAAQCMATLALVRRETNSWKWPLFMLSYMTILAYLMSLIVFQGGTLLGIA